tara:strand:+ start:38 stop:700 length:663 start_codon:yes stop_codon:yes gene_type:complete
MSLLDQASKNVSFHKLRMRENASKDVEEKFIVQPNVLLDILNDEMNSRLIDKKQKKQFAGYRTRLSKSEWRLAGILNYVDEPLYREQIGKTIQGMLKHIKLVQPNGEWVVLEYETDIRKNEGGDQAIMLAVNFVDAKNEQDMRYQNGIPAVDVKVDVSNSNKELIEAIQSQGVKSDDGELKDLMKQFIAAVAQNGLSAQPAPAEEKKSDVLDEVPSDFQE